MNEKKQTLTLAMPTTCHTGFAAFRAEAPVGARGVSRVLGVSAEILCEQTDLLENSANFGGTVRLHVLVVDDQGAAQVQQLQASLQTQLELTCSPTMSATVTGSLQEANAAIENNRIVVEGVAALTMTVTGQKETAVLAELDGEPQLQTLPQTVCAHTVRPLATAVRTLAGDVTLPSRLPDIDRVLSLIPTVRLEESHLSAGRVFLRGEAQVQLMYVCPQGELYTVPMSLPFDTAIDVNTEEEPEVTVVAEQAEAGVENDSEGSPRVLRLNVVARFSAQTTGQATVTLLSDAFLPNGALALQTQPLHIAGPMINQISNETITATLPLPEGMPAIGRVLATMCQPAAVMAESQQGHAMVSGMVNFTLIYTAVGDGGLYGTTMPLPFTAAVDNSRLTPGTPMTASILPSPAGATAQTAFEAECRIPYTLQMKAYPATEVSAVVAAELAEPEPMPGLCAMIFTRPGDTPWAVCKRYGVSPQTLNDLNPEMPEAMPAGTRLLLYREIV